MTLAVSCVSYNPFFMNHIDVLFSHHSSTQCLWTAWVYSDAVYVAQTTLVVVIVQKAGVCQRVTFVCFFWIPQLVDPSVLSWGSLWSYTLLRAMSFVIPQKVLTHTIHKVTITVDFWRWAMHGPLVSSWRGRARESYHC